MAVPWQELGLDHFHILIDGKRHPWQPAESAGSTGRFGEPFDVEYPDGVVDVAEVSSIDLRLLARVLLPTLRDHKLSTLCAHYDISVSERRGPEPIARLFAALLDEALRVDRQVLALLGQLVPSPLSQILQRTLLLAAPSPAVDVPTNEKPLAGNAIFAVSLDEALDPTGPLAGAFDAFELRPGQIEMARAVEHAFTDGETLLVEAGPGTGKTFAYLIPAILLLARQPEARVAISTRTKQLQEQLFTKDLPFLVAHMAPNLKVALLKGRENYLCLRRWQALIDELIGTLDRQGLSTLAPLVRWIAETPTGDIEENSAFHVDATSRGVWGRLCDSPNHCVGSFCAFQEECFSVLARRRARRADLVVVNHSLLLGDLAVDGVVLGSYSHLVVDEGHGFEAAARIAFTDSLSERSISRVTEDLSSSSRRRRGWAERLSLASGKDDVERVIEIVSAVRKRAAVLLREMDAALPDEQRGAFESFGEQGPSADDVLASLAQLEQALDRLTDHIDDDLQAKELEGHITMVGYLQRVVRRLSEAPVENAVHWFERIRGELSLHATPLDIVPFFKQWLYPRVDGLVLTSATLSVAGDFGFLRRALGLAGEDSPVEELIVDSPFAHPDRMKILVPSYLPRIDGAPDDYARELADLLATLVRELDRKGLVLFTSYRLLNAVRDRLPTDVARVCQGTDGPRSKLIERFRAHRGGKLLLGTESFWEGVDFPGEELEFLVVTRLPFPVPTDPILVALGERAAAAGRDAFFDLSLPLAVLKLRQGVGRLIRTQDDIGVVVITDQRIITRSYGARFTDSLPVSPIVSTSPEALMAEISGWLRPEA
ncbi:helicase C-terminal domain-containing protein [Candidatus Bipolaricaulota bacterium]